MVFYHAIFHLPPSIIFSFSFLEHRLLITMSPLPVRPSKRRVADQRPDSVKGGKKRKRKPHVPLPKAFLSKDFNFPAPEGYRQPKAPRRRKVHKVPRPRNLNGLDPFQRLGDDEVYNIISYLSAEDTETLRRVSRFWKATSEHHCGKSILAQTLPWVPLQDLAGLSREELNLQYRRHCMWNSVAFEVICYATDGSLLILTVYHHRSLQLAQASRAIKFSGVYDWSLNGNAIAWVGGSNQVFTRLLKAPNGCPISSSDEMIDLEPEVLPNHWIPYVLLTKRGDSVVLHRFYDNVDDAPAQKPILNLPLSRCPRSVDKLAKITSTGKQWTLKLEGSICKPAVGKDALYFMEDQSQGQADTNCKTTFNKVSLANGRLMYSQAPPEIEETGIFVRHDQAYKGSEPSIKVGSPTPGRKIEIMALDTSLKLAGNEEVAVWSDSMLRVHVFSTATGHVLFTYDRQCDTILMASAIRPQVWDASFHLDLAGFPTLRVASYDTSTETLTCAPKQADYFAEPHPWRAPCFIDADRPVIMDLCHDFLDSIGGYNFESRDPFTTVEVAGLEKAVLDGEIVLGDITRPRKNDKEEDSRALVTLPSLPGHGPQRRLLELEAPWTMDDRDFFGLVEGYLVYYNFADKELILIDFWPSW